LIGQGRNGTLGGCRNGAHGDARPKRHCNVGRRECRN
jgi:hypothetical protein